MNPLRANVGPGEKSRGSTQPPAVAVVIPCYRVAAKVLDVLAGIGPECQLIYVVDDACPEGTGALVRKQCTDPRVRVLRHPENQGVGGAVMTGYRAALEDGADIVVKIDGDGQMDPALVPLFVGPILRQEADYAKGNRFYNPDDVAAMPRIRLFGNAALSFMNKFSSGYWDIFDPTNGYTAIGRSALKTLPLEKISKRYFFETDMLFRLGLSRAVVQDVPMTALYAGEKSSLRVSRILGEFLYKHSRNYAKRIFYLYYLRDFTIASVELLACIAIGAFAVVYGGANWLESYTAGKQTPVGTIVVTAVATLASFQLLLSFLGFDSTSVPRRVLPRTPMPPSTGDDDARGP